MLRRSNLKNAAAGLHSRAFRTSTTSNLSVTSLHKWSHLGHVLSYPICASCVPSFFAPFARQDITTHHPSLLHTLYFRCLDLLGQGDGAELAAVVTTTCWPILRSDIISLSATHHYSTSIFVYNGHKP